MPISVLVVDDHPLYRDGVVAALSRRGSNIRVVAEVGCAGEALATALELQPEIVLTDLRLPDQDGAWLTSEVVRRLPHTRVVVVTGFDEPSIIATVLDAGASAVLTKDASAEQLHAAILAVSAGGEMVSAQVARLLAGYQMERDRSADSQRDLSAREREVLARLATGESNRQIAERLVVSVRTVDNHVRNIYSKLGVHDRAQAALSAARLGLVAVATPRRTA